MSTLKRAFDFIAEEYISKFIKKHKYEFTGWVGGDKVTAGFIDEYFFSYDDIRLDIDMKLPKGLIFKWQDAYIDHHDKTGNRSSITLKSYAFDRVEEHLNQ